MTTMGIQPGNRENNARKNPAKRFSSFFSWIFAPLNLPRMAAVAATSLTLALGLTACENVAGTTSYALVRVIDASYVAQTDYPAGLNFFVEGTEIASAVGEGYVSGYGTFPASTSATVKITSASSSSTATLVSTSVTLNKVITGNQYTVFLTDKGSSDSGYTVTAVQDQSTAAASGKSAFRFYNEASSEGAVDLYLVPSSSTLAKTKVFYSDLAVGSSTGYISFTSQTVTLYVVPTGTDVTSSSSSYTSEGSFSLTGGEVRTLIIINSELTTDPATSVVVAKDVN
jgi:hypothetical protein